MPVSLAESTLLIVCALFGLAMGFVGGRLAHLDLLYRMVRIESLLKAWYAAKAKHTRKEQEQGVLERLAPHDPYARARASAALSIPSRDGP